MMNLMVLTAALLVGGSGQSRADLITNGSFELASPGYSPPTLRGSLQSLPDGSTAMLGWTVFGGPASDGLAWNPSLNTGPSSNGMTAQNGIEFLDLTGFFDQKPYFGVSQTISTAPGQSYILSFYLGNASQYDGGNSTIAAQVIAGPVTQTFTDNFAGTAPEWTQYSVDFTAIADLTTISIQGTQGFAFIGLDNVSVNVASAVPEPGSLILGSIATISGLGYWCRRRRLLRHTWLRIAGVGVGYASFAEPQCRDMLMPIAKADWTGYGVRASKGR